MTEQKSSLLKNLFSLSAMQAVSNVVQLVTIPLIIRAIGIDKFGVVSLALSFTGYMIIASDYGFYLTATGEVAKQRSDKAALSAIFSRVMSVKFFIAAIALVFTVVAVLLVPQFEGKMLLFLLTYSMVLGNVLFPNWLYFGLERAAMVSWCIIIARFMYLCGVFFLVKSESDFILVNLLNGLSNLLPAIYAFYFAIAKLDIVFRFIGLAEIIADLKSGWHTFITWISNYIYLNSNILILSSFAGETAIGYYALAEKVTVGLTQAYNIVFQVTYPRANALLASGKDAVNSFLNKVGYGLTGLLALIGLAVIVWSDEVVYLLSGTYIPEASLCLKICAMTPAAMAFRMKPYQQYLIYGFKKTQSRVFQLSAVFGVGVCWVLSKEYSYTGTATAFLLAEVFAASALYLGLLNKQLHS